MLVGVRVCASEPVIFRIPWLYSAPTNKWFKSHLQPPRRKGLFYWLYAAAQCLSRAVVRECIYLCGVCVVCCYLPRRYDNKSFYSASACGRFAMFRTCCDDSTEQRRWYFYMCKRRVILLLLPLFRDDGTYADGLTFGARGLFQFLCTYVNGNLLVKSLNQILSRCDFSSAQRTPSTMWFYFCGSRRWFFKANQLLSGFTPPGEDKCQPPKSWGFTVLWLWLVFD